MIIVHLAILALGAVLGFRAHLLAAVLSAAYIMMWYVAIEPWIQGLGGNTVSLVSLLLAVPTALLAVLTVVAWWLAAGIIVGFALRCLTVGTLHLLGNLGGGR